MRRTQVHCCALRHAHILLIPVFGQVFFGDDTWTRLYPRTFSRATPYPSFNLHDFHTTDNGVWAVSASS